MDLISNNNSMKMFVSVRSGNIVGCGWPMAKSSRNSLYPTRITSSDV
jgi:hypothetical protein